VVAFARQREADLVTPLSTASRLIELIHGETQLLAALLLGFTLEEVDELLCATYLTMKTNLDATCIKIGERRRPDIVQRVMGLRRL
jgi:hypothetical protein